MKDHEIALMIARDDIARLKAKLVKTEAKAAELRDQIDSAENEVAELRAAPVTASGKTSASQA